MNYDLSRFLKAQESDYETALAEIRSGRKRSHWIWYIFPQLKGLGFSTLSYHYGIDDIDEAKAYMKDPVLSARLIEISRALLALDSSDPGREFHIKHSGSALNKETFPRFTFSAYFFTFSFVTAIRPTAIPLSSGRHQEMKSS